MTSANDNVELLQSLQASLTELARQVGLDPDGLNDDSVLRAIGRRFDEIKTTENAD